MTNFQRITVDPAQMGGVPCVRYLRIPVATVLRLLAGGRRLSVEKLADALGLAPGTVVHHLRRLRDAGLVTAHPRPPYVEHGLRLDRLAGEGMTTVVGRLRPDPVLANGIKLVLLSHNTKMGAARGATLLAEYLVHRGLA